MIARIKKYVPPPAARATRAQDDRQFCSCDTTKSVELRVEDLLHCPNKIESTDLYDNVPMIIKLNLPIKRI